MVYKFDVYQTGLSFIHRNCLMDRENEKHKNHLSFKRKAKPIILVTDDRPPVAVRGCGWNVYFYKEGVLISLNQTAFLITNYKLSRFNKDRNKYGIDVVAGYEALYEDYKKWRKEQKW